MKVLILALALIGHGLIGPDRVGSPLCAMAPAAQITIAAQERQVPEGEWCQRPAPKMAKEAHACACHQHDCADEDPLHLSAHTDPGCLDYCHTARCRCLAMDCP